MISRDWAYAYHSALPSDCPQDNWKRVEIHVAKDLGPIVKAMTDGMKALGYPRKDRFAVELAAWEATVNAIKHGHGGDPSRTVLLSYCLGPTEVLLEVADEGFGFNPYLIPNPLDEMNLDRDSGRGLFLMRVYMTWIRFNKRGNRVTLCKRRSES
ncbi:MAG TPA: ATP-binding protein [Gemmataceae bacterium]|jgi:serine/threonine-protein kinase RsbW|nr:ATP-binding protein [Gemmataceae bacterium]